LLVGARAADNCDRGSLVIHQPEGHVIEYSVTYSTHPITVLYGRRTRCGPRGLRSRYRHPNGYNCGSLGSITTVVARGSTNFTGSRPQARSIEFRGRSTSTDGSALRGIAVRYRLVVQITRNGGDHDSVSWQHCGGCRQRLAVGSPRTSLPRALLANSLCRGQENRTMLMSKKSKLEVANRDPRTNWGSKRFC